ncbi:MAG: rhomboid family intramembrane serine protease [Anaerolineae bacterium]|jgi:rhomboid protease GluP|nr:rhomboid family intramembrane serine protease [Anaerolineae bacterium]
MFDQPTNDQPPAPKPKRPHPLEVPPIPEASQPTRQRGMLHIRVVKPYLTYGLIAVNVAIFITAFYIISLQQFNDLYRWGANNHREVLQGGQYHRLVTAMFLHGSSAHIIFNMLSLYFIGTTIERFFGHIRFGLIYVLGGLSGSVLSVLLNPPLVTSVGASGAVFAIFGAQYIFWHRHRKLFGETAKQQMRQLILIGGMNFAVGILSTFDLGEGAVSIDNWGHLGGLLGGLAVAWLISPNFLLEKHPTQENAFSAVDMNPLKAHYTNLILYGAGLMAVLVIGTFFARGGFR